MATSEFQTIDLSLIPSGTVAPKEVATSGIEIRSLPTGTYTANVVHAVSEMTKPDDMYNPNRLIVKVRFRTESGKLIFADVSHEPAQNDTGLDAANRLYSQIEQALDMYGEDINEVYQAMAEATYTLKVQESARIEVGKLDDELKEFYLQEKGFGEFQEVTVYIGEDEEDKRVDLAQRGGKMRNFIRELTLG